MSNMSYCRFRNTEGDLAECLNELDEPSEKLAPAEREAGIDMINNFLKWCRQNDIIEEWDESEIVALFDNHTATVDENEDEDE